MIQALLDVYCIDIQQMFCMLSLYQGSNSQQESSV